MFIYIKITGSNPEFVDQEKKKEKEKEKQTTKQRMEKKEKDGQ